MKIIALLLLAAAVSSCAHTRVSSIKAPVHPTYHKVLLYAAYKDIDVRTAYERALGIVFEEHHTNCLSSIVQFPPLRDYSDSELNAKMKRLGVEAILSLSPDGSSTKTKTSWNALTQSWDTYDVTDGLYTVAKVTDLESGEVVYKANLATGMGELTEMATARQNIADELFDDLLKNGFVSTYKE